VSEGILDVCELEACDNDATSSSAQLIVNPGGSESETRASRLPSLCDCAHQGLETSAIHDPPNFITKHTKAHETSHNPKTTIMAPRNHEEDISIDSAPTTINPYTVLSVPSDATPSQIKTAYRKAALKHHPDKAPESKKAAAHTKFQEIAFANAILSDERRRKRFDVTGRTEESLDLDDDTFDWISYYREQYKDVVTADVIESFADKYKGSEEEKRDVLSWFEKCEGKMTKLYKNVMLSDPADDEERFRGIIDAAIESGEVEGYEAYTEESENSRKKRVDAARKRKEKEAKEAEKHAADLGIGKDLKKKGKKEKDGGMGDLAALIGQRQQGRSDNFLADLEAKYAPKGKAKAGAKRATDEPPEEAFAATEAGRRSKRSKKN
jgi:DnaJ family protein C protein 9